MATEAELTAQIEALKAAQRRGVRKATYSSGASVEYASFAELKQALTDAEAELAALQGNQRTNALVFKTSRGW